MSDPYLIDCGGHCRTVWELHPPYAVLFNGLLHYWLIEEEGWSRSKTGAWICPDCTRQEEKDDGRDTETKAG